MVHGLTWTIPSYLKGTNGFPSEVEVISRSTLMLGAMANAPGVVNHSSVANNSKARYGYHISVLNQLNSSLTCKQPSLVETRLPPCFQLNDFTFSVVTSVFNLGGLLGSSQANVFMESYGRKGTARISIFLTVLGSAIMGLSGSVASLGVGR